MDNETATIIEEDDFEDELTLAEQEEEQETEAAEAAKTMTVVTFKTPAIYNGKPYDSLTFDWDKLTDRDALNIEYELRTIGKSNILPIFNGEYLIRMAAKACSEPINSDLFRHMSIADYNRVKTAARGYLLKAEMESAAENAGNDGVTVVTLQDPIAYKTGGVEKTVASLTFVWNAFTGADDLKIEYALSKTGQAIISGAHNAEYLTRMAAIVCTESITADIFKKLSFFDFYKIRSAASSFLLT